MSPASIPAVSSGMKIVEPYSKPASGDSVRLPFAERAGNPPKLPLATDVGAALAAYLRHDRRRSAARRVSTVAASLRYSARMLRIPGHVNNRSGVM
jgi:hypothetical protein